MSDLSIIIVNYKTPQLVIDCLATVYAQTRNVSFEVYIVDNASGDNSQQLITAAYPQVQWIQQTYNSGFARANNEGIRQSSGQVVLLLNSDTLVKDEAIDGCYKAFVHSSYVACGVQLLNTDLSPQISGSYIMKGGLNHLLPLPYTGALLKWMGNLFKVSKPNVPDSSYEVEVDWINGAFLMVKRPAMEKAGLMDEDFFLVAEEAEWCSRLKKQGRLCIYGQYKVVHLQGVTTNKAFQSQGTGYYNVYDKKGLQIMLSNIVRIRKQFGVGWYLFHLLANTLTIPLFFVAGIIENIFRLKNPFAHFPRAAKYTVNVSKLWRYVFIIISNKPYFYKAL